MNIAYAIPCGLLRTNYGRPCFRSVALVVLSSTRTWWLTGEDSNLRSPQGAADLQYAGFSHSPSRPRKLQQLRQPNLFKKTTLRAKTQNGLVSSITGRFNLIS